MDFTEVKIPHRAEDGSVFVGGRLVGRHPHRCGSLVCSGEVLVVVQFGAELIWFLLTSFHGPVCRYPTLKKYKTF